MQVYIHVPFCTHICSYCDFPKVLYCHKYINKYLDNIEHEIRTRYQGETITSLYIGGGTPTSLSILELERLLKILEIFNLEDNIEYTIESNVESLTPDKIKLLTKYHVNRVSLGIQTFSQRQLEYLGRYHTKKQVYQVVSNLKENGISNINIDLIYGIDKDKNIVKENIKTFLELDVPHISCYSLIIEEHTLLNNKHVQYIDEDIEYEMYIMIKDMLMKQGYIHYEISNYAKKGYESKHNLGYWHNQEYYGFGMGAVSYLHNYRISNTLSLTKYLDGNYVGNKEYEDEQRVMENDVILALRTTKGLNLDDFYHKHQKKVQDIFNIKELLDNKQLIIKDNYLYINPEYLYISNEIILHFI